MDENTIQQTNQKSPIPPVTPTPPQPPVAPVKSKNWILIRLVLLVIFLSLGIGGFFAYRYALSKQQVAITTYEACSSAPDSIVQTSYPAICVTRDGKRFTQPLTDEEQQNLLPPVAPQILGIQLTQCCSCPTLIDSSQIGQNDWVAYEQGKDYTAERPKACSMSNIGVCAPCPPLETKSFTCPVNGWVDCMPGPDAKPECSTEAMLWYKTNCPDFKGGAL